ncbi:putative DNA helicase [Lupinus albus]|uniref:Chromatin-remodeling ATPase INO80 n=1 Tax=Lupinus albus TaxID=3870 RepID=A0A6A4NUF6_LUPAL|nr:putative DNA helicase [Lupinus albus]
MVTWNWLGKIHGCWGYLVKVNDLKVETIHYVEDLFTQAALLLYFCCWLLSTLLGLFLLLTGGLILQDYMNYRKYKYFRLDGSSTIQDRRDMVRDFQHRSDIFVFLLSTRAGGLGINLTAADTVIFYESDWNPTLDLQAMDRAHRLGQTKDVTVYRLICKETVEEKILLRASQKSTVQNLVMTGGSVGGDILAPEDVVSLLLDDPQLEQKLKEIPLQVKDKQKRKQSLKGIRLSEEGDASLEDLTNSEVQGTTNIDLPMEPEGPKSSNKKRKVGVDKQISRPKNSQKRNELGNMAIDDELNDVHLNTNPLDHTPKRTKKRTKKNVNEKCEEVFTGTTTTFSNQTHFPPHK